MQMLTFKSKVENGLMNNDYFKTRLPRFKSLMKKALFIFVALFLQEDKVFILIMYNWQLMGDVTYERYSVSTNFCLLLIETSAREVSVNNSFEHSHCFESGSG